MSFYSKGLNQISLYNKCNACSSVFCCVLHKYQCFSLSLKYQRHSCSPKCYKGPCLTPSFFDYLFFTDMLHIEIINKLFQGLTFCIHSRLVKKKKTSLQLGKRKLGPGFLHTNHHAYKMGYGTINCQLSASIIRPPGYHFKN